MSILDRQLAEGRVYRRLTQRARRLADTLEGIATMRDVAPRSYLSLSFGKQSIVLAHMLFQVQPTMPMYFLASGESWFLHNYAEVIAAFTERFPVNLTIVQTDHVFDNTETCWQESRDAGSRDLQNMCDRREWDGWYWGLAKEESRQRRITLSIRNGPHPSIFQCSDGKYRCCPLANWELLDLAAYLDEYNLPLLRMYHAEGLSARTTARVTRKCAENGGIAHLKHADLEAYTKLVTRFPYLSTLS